MTRKDAEGSGAVYLSSVDPEYIDSMYQDYRADPESVGEDWRHFFEGFDFGQETVSAAPRPERTAEEVPTGETAETVRAEIKVTTLIHEYRRRGHLFTRTNPVRERRRYEPDLSIENFGLSDDDLDTVFQAGREIGIGPSTLRGIIDHLEQTYCSSIGVEFMFIRDPDKTEWLQKKMESTRNSPDFSVDEKKQILKKLTEAVGFEQFLHTKFVGQKRFALSGGEALIPGLNAILEKGSEMGIEEFVLGMAHRGRLNVLANIMRQGYEQIFEEFEGQESEDSDFEGDVKYHLGFSNDVTTSAGKKLHLNLVPNPSHLEAVNSVAEGIVRSKIDKRYGGDYSKIAPVLIHGDAAISGQGVVYELIQMSLLEAHKTGGTIHLVINNQIGFTTNYIEGRSSTYCTDVAKVTLSPVFHVNADDAEAVVYAIQLALEYRQTFHTDVFIDFLGYRKYGHNEADEPRFTQPKLYDLISAHDDPRKIYEEELIEQSVVSRDYCESLEADFKAILQKGFEESQEKRIPRSLSTLTGDWSGFRPPEPSDFDESPETGVEKNRLVEIGKQILNIPQESNVFRKLRKLYEGQLKRLVEEERLDWALAEYLAYGTLLAEGVPVRLSGQDSVRGTFAHRHAVLLEEGTEERYIPLNNISEDQARFQVFNTLLSEYAVLGFEYGYAWGNPKGLTIWEAQFGDFFNGAQIIIDQFLTCAEAKWKRFNGLVMYLPHGFEGQGPEHSSARIERFLSLSASENMQIVNPTTPANFFHVLRRQMTFPFRIPLVIFTPKSLLRHSECVSDIDDFTSGGFREVIDDDFADVEKVKKVHICSGKLYYELVERQRGGDRRDTALVRLEQIYPFPQKQLSSVLSRYSDDVDVFWVQEEPLNMGAWTFVSRKFDGKIDVIARRESPTPATGFHKQHEREQKRIIDAVFGDESK